MPILPRFLFARRRWLDYAIASNAALAAKVR